MVFSYDEEMMDELPCVYLCWPALIQLKILIYPDFPMMAGVDSDHSGCRNKKAKDIDEDFIPDQHLLQEVYDLGERQFFNV